MPLEADIVLVRDSGLRRNDEIGLLNCLIIKCQHYLVTGEVVTSTGWSSATKPLADQE